MAEEANEKRDENPAESPVPPVEEKGEKRKPNTVSISDLELESLRREAAEYKDKYQRALAESENARKRLQKERQELVQYALQNAMVDILNPIDHLENALKFAQEASPDIKHWALGFQMILNQFKDVLASNGVVSFVSEGTHFDPHCHEAVETLVTKDYPPGTVISESLKGYKMGDRTIRPARVKVAKAPKEEAKPQEESLKKEKE